MPAGNRNAEFRLEEGVAHYGGEARGAIGLCCTLDGKVRKVGDVVLERLGVHRLAQISATPAHLLVVARRQSRQPMAGSTRRKLRP